jgi:two-component system chemotaxis response regulator CheB
MPGHDIIVIGASAGGIRAVSGVIAMLPADLPAAAFVAMHLAAESPGRVPDMIAEASALSVGPAVDGERIVHGHVYVAPPDHHLLVGREYIRVLRGPRENRFRPSIDVLFRSAARAYGPRVIGVVLTGYLADGTLGLQAIKRRGGITIAQDPRDAEYPGMPESALRYARVDHRLRLTDIPSRLIELVAEPAPEEELHPVPLDLEVEARIAEQEMSYEELLEAVQLIGRRSPFSLMV